MFSSYIAQMTTGTCGNCSSKAVLVRGGTAIEDSTRMASTTCPSANRRPAAAADSAVCYLTGVDDFVLIAEHPAEMPGLVRSLLAHVGADGVLPEVPIGGDDNQGALLRRHWSC